MMDSPNGFGSKGSMCVLLCVAAALGGTLACQSSEELESVSQRTQASVSATRTTEFPCSSLEKAAAATQGSVSVQSAGKIDSYDSSAGNYGGSNVGSNATVEAATNIVLNGGTISGSQIQNSPTAYETVAVPSDAIALPLGATSPGALNINRGQSVTLPPGNYVVQDVNINYSGQVHISPAGEVNIYVLGNLNLGGNLNVGGSPAALKFLVASSGWVNVNSSGKLYGSIYAPTAAVNINSPIYGSVVGRQITVNSGGAIHQDESMGCSDSGQPPPIAVKPPRSLPPPPTQDGCYIGTPNGWKATDCTYDGTVENYFPTPGPEPAIQSHDENTSPPILLEYGEVDATLSAFGSVTDQGPFGSGPDAFSVQLNTNYFDRPGGNTGWVQFVVQNQATDPMDPDDKPLMGVCIWDWLNAVGTWDYETKCVGDMTEGLPASYTLYRHPGTYRQFDFATVAASVFQAGAARKMGMVVQLSWYDPNNDPDDKKGLYSVVKTDSSGLYQNWTAVGGGVFGEGGGSTSVFSETSVVTRMLAGSCVNAMGPQPDVPWPGSCPDQPPLLPNTRVVLLDPDTNKPPTDTGEGHNFEIVGGESGLTLAASTPDLVFTQFLLSTETDPTDPTNGVCLDQSQRVYVKDNPSDNGVVPSNINGQPFWQSPDLFLVPAGATVSPDAPAPPIVVVPGQTYDAYMRVNNDYSCEEVTGVKVKMHLADPAALSQSWGQSITPGAGYAGPAQAPGGVTIPAGGHALVGPFSYTAPTLGGAGHKCMIGSVVADGQPAPADEFDAPNYYQVAQRNLAVDECTYPLTNALSTWGWVQLTLTADGALPSLTGDNDISMTFFDPLQDWYNTWLPGASSGTYSVTFNSTTTETTVRLGPPTGTTWMGETSVTLPWVRIEAGVTIAATGAIGLGAGQPDTILSIEASQFGFYGDFILNNGGSCSGLAPAPVNCGDGALDSDEECDDGNTSDGDGCDHRCKIEPVCGDGKLDPGEECDDGNTDPTDGCHTTCTVPTGEGPFLENDGLVVIEAEHFTSSSADLTTDDSWSLTSEGTASGGACMFVGPDNGQSHVSTSDAASNSAHLGYDVSLVTPGTWYVWVRGRGPNSVTYEGDSCHVGIDGVIATPDADYPDNATYAWEQNTIKVSGAGDHVVQIFMREDGFRADKIIMTTDSGYVPQGINQVENPRL